MQTFTPHEYTKIDVANNFGLDKLEWNKRIEWTNNHVMNNLYNESVIQDLMEEADNPFLFRKGIYALRDIEESNPTGFLMSLDATCSGLQLYAVLTGCYETAKKVNLINTGKREDAYTHMATTMSQFTKENYPRKPMKQALMTVLYGSKAEPKKLFGEGEHLKAFYNTLNKEFPGAVEGLNAIQSTWRSDVLAHEWKLPDGHVAHVKVMEEVDKRIEIDELNHATYTFKTYQNNTQDYGISNAANVIHSCDAYVVREMVRRAHKQGFELLTIHDSFQ